MTEQPLCWRSTSTIRSSIGPTLSFYASSQQQGLLVCIGCARVIGVTWNYTLTALLKRIRRGPGASTSARSLKRLESVTQLPTSETSQSPGHSTSEKATAL